MPLAPLDVVLSDIVELPSDVQAQSIQPSICVLLSASAVTPVGALGVEPAAMLIVSVASVSLHRLNRSR